jgi:hypothetical protein
MSVHRSLIASIVTTTATLGLLILGSSQVASATVAPHAAGPSADRGAYGSAPDTTAAPDAVSPSGCLQRVDHPHQSIHEPGTADGVVTTSCRVSIPEISHSAQMWETRWWGWDRIGHKGSVRVFNSRSASTTAWDWCKKNTVRVTGNGYVVDIDGRAYYASTESIHVKNPCHL